MNLDTLRVYCDVVRLQSFSRGAAANKISQSAASQAVHQLERHLGVQLIDRTKRPFVLTPEGELWFEGLKEVIRSYDDLEERVRSMRQEVAGLVRIAAIYSIGLHDMSECMRDFMTTYPEARVRLEYLRPGRVYEAVLDEEVDLGIVSYPSTSRGLTVIPLRSENMVLVCHPDHRLARLERVTINQLQNEELVTFDRDLLIRKELDKHFRQNQVVVHVAMEFDNIETIKQAIEVGVGVSILPEPTVRKEVQMGTLVATPFAISEMTRPIGIIHRQRKIFTPTIARFVELLKKISGTDADNGGN